jgi:hypothetical protein
MSLLELIGAVVGLIVAFITIMTAVIAAGAWILKNHHKANVEPAITKVQTSLERTIEATDANTRALAKSEEASRQAQRENRETFDGIREIVQGVRIEQAEHAARLDGHDIELRDLKRVTGGHRE